MRLKMILPKVEPGNIILPEVCPRKKCKGKHFQFVQEVDKAIRDTQQEQVQAQRYQCLKCGHTFRAYPKGVTRAQTSQRVQGLAILMYLLGLSYGAVSLVLEALGTYMCKSRVYDVVQAAAERVPGLKREQVFAGVRTPAIGADLTSIKCNGKWLPIGLTVDGINGTVLTVDLLSGEDADTLKEWIEPIAEAVGAELFISDDADALKSVADELGLEHQVCKSHVKRNTQELIDELKPLALEDKDGSLGAIGVSSQQAVADLERLDELVRTRQQQDESELEEMHYRYIDAPLPAKGEKASLAYRLRLLFLDRWNLWRRLTRYRSWRGPNGETIDGTNNGSERAIGWWIKERFRTMRGYKRPKSAINISRFLAWAGNHLKQDGADLMPLLA